MRFVKKYDKFLENNPAVEPAVKPARPKVDPGTKPKRRQRPTPIRRTRPSVEPNPKATEEDVAERFIKLMDEKGEDIKNYVKEEE